MTIGIIALHINSVVFRGQKPKQRFLRNEIVKKRALTDRYATSTLLTSVVAEKPSVEVVDKVLNSEKWDQFLDRSRPSPGEDSILAELDELVPTDECAWKKVDYAVEQLLIQGHNDKALDFLEVCVECNLARDDSFSQFIRICTSLKRFDSAAQIAMKWIISRQKEFRGHAANSLMYYAHVCQRVDTSLELLKLMQQYGTRLLSDYPFAITIHTCNKKKRWSTALEVYKLFKKSGLQPTPVLIRNFLHTIRLAGYKNLLESVVDDIEAFDVSLTPTLHGYLMETCKRFHDLETAVRVFNVATQRGRKIDIRAFNSLLVIFKQARKFPSVETCFQTIEQANLEPDVYTFGLLFGIASETFQPLRVIDDLIEKARIWKIPFSTIMLHSALVGYHRATNDPAEIRIKRALNLLALNKDCADETCHAVALLLCTDLEDVDVALQIKHHMDIKGYNAADSTLLLLAKLCKKSGLKVQGLELQLDVEDRKSARSSV